MQFTENFDAEKSVYQYEDPYQIFDILKDAINSENLQRIFEVFIAAISSDRPDILLEINELPNKFKKEILNYKDSRRGSLLHYAVSKSCKLSVLNLIKCGFNVNIADTNKNTPLHIACMNPKIAYDILIILLKKGADVNSKNKKFETPLILAASQGTLKTVQILCKNNADIEHQDILLETAIFKAAKRGALDIVEYMAENNLGVEVIKGLSLRNILHIMAMANTLTPKLLKVLSEKIDINAEDIYGKTPLQYTLIHNIKKDLLDTYIELDADLKFITDLKNSPRLIEEGGCDIINIWYLDLVRESQNRKIKLRHTVENPELLFRKYEDSRKESDVLVSI
ncbi:MAG: ankyrin repeat domain-containing protein [Alphaproteobacteria bacterium]|nr:ankyrin repeat domain-containing protein [Alphaproteobacteria bacterium]OJV16098.1 MAG: hypothetical protein BGO27_03825 [Alphaproteobacteria bacterium 33-17]